MKLLNAAVFLASAASPAFSQQVVSVHGSGTTNPSKCYWQIMDQMQIMSKLPIRMTYRGVGSSTGQAEFIGNGTLSDNMFGSGDIPLSAEDYSMFPEGSVFHLPIVIGAISFFHSVPTGDKQLNISPCVLAKIFNRKITVWTDPEIITDNPDLDLPDAMPIIVARRVLGSSSTSSITAYLNQVCPDEWPEEMVGSTIEWPADTLSCEGSSAMTACITGNPGTIGYIESGHGHAQGLQEIELLNKAQSFISSKEAAEKGGILAAVDNAIFPDSLDGDFSDVNLLNQVCNPILYILDAGDCWKESYNDFVVAMLSQFNLTPCKLQKNQVGTNTWPIVAISYIYVKKDLTFIEDPAAQTLLQTFLRALYDPEWITQCEDEFGFLRVNGTLRDQALDAIDSLTTSTGAPQWTFEYETEKRLGQGEYVISTKRQSYSEVEQDNLVDKIATLIEQIESLQAENAKIMKDAETTGALQSVNDGLSEEDSQVKTALILSSISFALWMLAILAILVRFVTGSHSTVNGGSGMDGASKAAESGDIP